MKKGVDLSICNKLLLKIMKDNWIAKIPKKPKLNEYQKFKEHIDLEEYLYLTKYKSSLVVKIKSGTLPQTIETGHYSTTPLENRLCTLCNSKLIESEFHFICICSKFEKNTLLSMVQHGQILKYQIVKRNSFIL